MPSPVRAPADPAAAVAPQPMISLPNFASFDPHTDPTAIGPRWERWLARFERLFVGIGLTDPTRKRALLLHYAGPDVDEIFDTLTETGDDDDYNTAKAKLTAHFLPKKNVAFEVYNFRQCTQAKDETLDAYHTRLRKLAKTCDFANVDREICAQIITGTNSHQLRRKALREDMNLTKILDTGRAFELSEHQATKLEESQHQTVNKIRAKDKSQGKGSQRQSRPKQKTRRFQSQSKPDQDRRRDGRDTRPQQQHNDQNCGKCGGRPHKVSSNCPANGQECHRCKKIGHFGRMCRSKTNRANTLMTEADEDSDYCYFTQAAKSNNPTLCTITIGKKPKMARVPMMIDSGASVNLVDSKTFNVIRRAQPGIDPLLPADTQVFPYGSKTPILLKGMFRATARHKSETKWSKFYVTEGGGNLLGFKTASDLGILKIVHEVKSKTRPNPSSSKTLPDSLKKYKELFSGVGKIKREPVTLHIDKDVKPKQQPHRRIPFHIRKDVEKELQRLEELDIIEKVDGPTPWISPIVTVPKKSGAIRICVDMREANKAIKRERHLMPTLDDLVTDLNGSTVFSTLDLSSAYHQLELAKESRFITTFTTHLGLRRYKRLFFGINAASEIFQNAIAEILSDIPNCRNISDDIIIHGKDKAEHDKSLIAVMERLKEYGIRLNMPKCHFYQSEVKFYGHIFNSAGVTADVKKIEAIRDAPAPTDKSGIRSLLGMAQYLSRFIPWYASITAPLRELTHDKTEWQWNAEHEKALTDLKTALTGAKVMSYYDPRKKTELIVDAGPRGLGSILMQEGRVVSYASRALTDVETRYSQTEREMLAVVWATEHFRLYLYGSTSPFTVVTDHKPLIGIFQSQKPMSLRIERWRLRLTPYNYKLEYRPGRNEANPADFCSRHPVVGNEQNRANFVDDYVNYVIDNAVPKAMQLEEVKSETLRDHTLQKLKVAIETGYWRRDEECLKPFKRFQDELIVHNGIVLRGRRLVMPDALQRRAIDLAHVGHQGIVKTKMLLREKVWFPSIDAMVEECVKDCLPCQATSGRASKPEPLRMTKLPNGPWEEVSVDFYGPLPVPSADYLLVMMDDYSRYPEVEVIASTAAKTVIPKIDAIMSRHGVVSILKSDNGPPFTSHDFKRFAEYLGFQHRRVTPLYPQANGEAERFMRNITKTVQAAHIEGRNWKQELQKFLRQYRATPHSTTGVSPFEALYGRRMKTQLPCADFNPELKTRSQSSMRDTDNERKQKIKMYADRRRNATESNIAEGDTVVVRQQKRNKLTPPFDPDPLKITRRDGNMLTAERDDRKITRNLTFFKRVPESLFENIQEEEVEIPDSDAPPTIAPETPSGISEPETSNQKLPVMTETTSQPLRRSTRSKRPNPRFKDFVLR
ncbi:uncharacterized protein K02A2.6-like [Lineus longissimus]|uniref:uncharacterized protein K02A2.6-like n=1 Tax=Lineus longissimus TaxID=88925 RepID=UPI00315DC60B